MPIAVVEEMGRDLERAWQAIDFDLRAFPQLCAERLERARLHARLDPDEIVVAALAGTLPQQSDPGARFGQPPVTLFRARRFYVDALYWVDGATSIHDHAFSGAFQVLSGSSIETNFTFTPSRDVDGHMRFGALAVLGSALRKLGDVRPFAAGPGYIHSLFHLARPSVSLVVRTFRDPAAGVQLEYATAGIAHDRQLEDHGRDRMVQIVEMLRKTEHPAFERLVGDLLAGADLGAGFAVLRACAKLTDAALLERLVDRLRVRDPDAAARIVRWMADRSRLELLINRRALIREPNLRFLLAVLLNAQRRADALAVVAATAPDVDPARQVAAWLRELAGVTIKLQVGSAPFEPNVLGLPAFGAGAEEALADYLAARTRPVTADERAFLERLRALPALAPLFTL